MRVHISANYNFYKSVALATLELLAFNEQKIRGHVTLATPPFKKNFKGHVDTGRYCPCKHVCQI